MHTGHMKPFFLSSLQYVLPYSYSYYHILIRIIISRDSFLTLSSPLPCSFFMFCIVDSSECKLVARLTSIYKSFFSFFLLVQHVEAAAYYQKGARSSEKPVSAFFLPCFFPPSTLHFFFPFFFFLVRFTRPPYTSSKGLPDTPLSEALSPMCV